jgi:hypothetical protein
MNKGNKKKKNLFHLSSLVPYSVALWFFLFMVLIEPVEMKNFIVCEVSSMVNYYGLFLVSH